MKVAFVHPDLGLGGAERLVVNAALALRQRGHDVSIYTAHFDRNRAFEETTQPEQLGGCIVKRGDWLPRHVCGKFHVVCAIIRMNYVSIVLLLHNIWLWFTAKPRFNVIICDQVSHVVPLLHLSGLPVLFYCHYPDKLLCTERAGLIKRLYRKPIDWLEEVTTGMATRVVVNSKFTGQVFEESFSSLSISTAVLYPAIELAQFDAGLSAEEWTVAISSLDPKLVNAFENGIGLLSINRFERKKNLLLAVETLHSLGKISKLESVYGKVFLVMAGGYDERLDENISYLKELKSRAQELGIEERVHFVLSFTDQQKLLLLQKARVVLYTPHNEHFGIVPIEAMYAGKPVVAVSSGGPLESIVQGKTGVLVEQNPEAFAEALVPLILDEGKSQSMGKAGHEHVAAKFSLGAFGGSLEKTLLDIEQQGSSLGFYLIVVIAVMVSLVAASYQVETS